MSQGSIVEPSGNSDRPATIVDVARRAGVSIKTVSRVANRQPNVRESTRSRVQQAIDELDYTPDPRARELALRRRASNSTGR